ncbi:aldehyde dehydrogenase family protein [Megasphaera sueciensis]|jgi:propionaldehyde dehydrogenase|uniref:aldehyde dehydrogenase family protein n=1 Tax=Megasphaera sueciensis TaxID=349094 RepID=UPI003D08BAA5
MMSTNIDPEVMRTLVSQVIKELKENGAGTSCPAPAAASSLYGVFPTMGECIDASAKAQELLLFQTPAVRQKWVEVIRRTCLDKRNMEMMSRMAVEETAIGRYEDKIIKNTAAAQYTPGIEDLTTDARTGGHGITLFEYCPFGVIGSITPTTNPTETIINNSICMIAGGNTVVFSPHPRARKTSAFLVQTLNRALEKSGAPANMITMVQNPSIEATNEMMASPKVRMLVATGGPGIVKTVLSSGKKAIGAGPGNPPVVVDETANIEQAAKDIVAGSSFDNNVPCIAEKEVFAVDSIFDYLLINMKGAGAYEIKDRETIEKLWNVVSKEKGGPKVEFVGKSAQYILDKIGIQVDDSIHLIIMETNKDHPFVQTEMMMPILPLVRCDNVDQAIEWAYESEHGNRHSAMMHSTNIAKLSKMAKLLQTTIFVKNGPSFAGLGIGGEGYPTFTIAGPTGEGLTSPKSFCRRRECVLKDMFNIR